MTDILKGNRHFLSTGQLFDVHQPAAGLSVVEYPQQIARIHYFLFDGGPVIGVGHTPHLKPGLQKGGFSLDFIIFHGIGRF